MERVEYGSVAIETNVPMSPRERVRLRAACRRIGKGIERSARQTQREVQRFLKTPEGEKWLVDRVVQKLTTQP